MSETLSESYVWGKFKKAWPYHCERHEPGGGFDSGFPDVLLQDKHGKPGMVELKRPDKVVLRPSQWAWMEIWYKGKGLCPVVTCRKKNEELVWDILAPMCRTRELIAVQPLNFPARSISNKLMSVVIAAYLGLEL